MKKHIKLKKELEQNNLAVWVHRNPKQLAVWSLCCSYTFSCAFFSASRLAIISSRDKG